VKLTQAVHYRVEQFVRALTAKHAISEQRVRRAADILSPEARALFVQQAPQDQRHALDVYETLVARGHTDKDLLTAALLHDVGKAAARIPVWQRAIFVLAEHLAPSIVERAAHAGTLRRQGVMTTYANHAEIGARWAEATGCSELAVELIRRHERPVDTRQTECERLLAALQAADNVS